MLPGGIINVELLGLGLGKGTILLKNLKKVFVDAADVAVNVALPRWSNPVPEVCLQRSADSLSIIALLGSLGQRTGRGGADLPLQLNSSASMIMKHAQIKVLQNR